MSSTPSDLYQYGVLPSSFRILELFPADRGDPIRLCLHAVDWPDPPPAYEAVSYTWGDPHQKLPVMCNGKRLEIPNNAHTALDHLRLADRSRFLWVDAVCVNQSNVPERGCQVAQMKRIYGTAKSVVLWLGEDAPEPQAKIAVAAVAVISDAICRQLGTSMSELDSVSDLYNEWMFPNRHRLPKPAEFESFTDATWQALLWLYSRPYFTRVWVVQEINANSNCSVRCGEEVLDWRRLELVAGYFVAEAARLKDRGFSKAYTWYAARISASGFTHAGNWLQMLYLASNFSCSDSRDQIFGLHGLIKAKEGASFLNPDYSKSVLQVYRDSVEAALLDFKTTDILNYVSGTTMGVSWVPAWNRPMLFRNPFRLGKIPPWRPAGESEATWKIDRDDNTLYLSGAVVDTIEAVEPYNELYFCDSKLQSEDGRKSLSADWQRILQAVGRKHQPLPLSRAALNAMATSLSFGVDKNADIADEDTLLANFIAYLKAAIDQETFGKYISQEDAELARHGEGNEFGKPVWDFTYPESTLFITTTGLIGCSVASNDVGDVVFVPLGCRYPLILRPDQGRFTIRGFAFVYGRMMREAPAQVEEVVIG